MANFATVRVKKNKKVIEMTEDKNVEKKSVKDVSETTSSKMH